MQTAPLNRLPAIVFQCRIISPRGSSAWLRLPKSAEELGRVAHLR
jgi:hypothetical protein